MSHRNNDSVKGTDLSANDFLDKQKKRKKRGVVAISKSVDFNLEKDSLQITKQIQMQG